MGGPLKKKTKKKKVTKSPVSRGGSMDRQVTASQFQFAYTYVRTNDKYKALDEAYPGMRGQKSPVRRMRVGILLKSPRVTLLIEEMRADIRQLLKFSQEQHVANLEELKQLAIEKGKISEAIRCEELMGKASGIYVDRKLSVKIDLSPDEMRNRARSLLEANPRLAGALGLEGDSLQRLLGGPSGPGREVIEEGEYDHSKTGPKS